jgi:thiol-disulfide isomerase/thioredoxin
MTKGRETYKFFVQFLTNKFEERKIMCQDNVTIHLIRKYYCGGKAWWYTDTAHMRKMCEEADWAQYTMCGKIAYDLKMEDTAGTFHRLYENLGDYTILFFYDPTCSHCKTVIPVVAKILRKHRSHGLRVYAVSTENKYTEWRQMMRTNKDLQEFVNVCKTDRYEPWPYYKRYYNITSNPTLFVIDRNKKIVAKKIDENQLEFFLESMMFEDGVIDTKPEPPKEKPKETHNGEKPLSTNPQG